MENYFIIIPMAHWANERNSVLRFASVSFGFVRFRSVRFGENSDRLVQIMNFVNSIFRAKGAPFSVQTNSI